MFNTIYLQLQICWKHLKGFSCIIVLTNMSDDLKYISECLSDIEDEINVNHTETMDILQALHDNQMEAGKENKAYQKQALVFYEIIAKNTLKEKA